METAIIALIFTGVGVLISYAKYQTNKDSVAKDESKENAFTVAKLDYISKGVDDIRLDIKTQDRRISDINDRLIRVEESTKSAHKRLNDLEKVD